MFSSQTLFTLFSQNPYSSYQSEGPILPLQTRLQSSLQGRLRSSSSPSSDTTLELSSDTTSKLFFALEDYPVNITSTSPQGVVWIGGVENGMLIGSSGRSK